MRRLVVLALVLAGCSRTGPDAAPQADLEHAAIAAGVIRDPADTEIAGLYARDTDRVCIVPDRVGYRIGATIDYGGGQGCSARGTVTRSGESLRVDLAGVAGCGFDAQLDGDRIVFPGRIPDACARLCTERASFAALEAELLSDVIAEASTLRDPKGHLLCGG